LKYRQETKGDYYTVWIDPATNLPVQMKIADAAEPSAATTSATFSNFQWDLPWVGRSCHWSRRRIRGNDRC